MTNAKKVLPSVLAPSDIELIERIIYRNSDDIAVSLARSFERLEERIDAAESRLHEKFDFLSDEMRKAEAVDSALTA